MAARCWPAVRVGFHGDKPGAGVEVWTRDVLNLGVSPARLVEAARVSMQAGGVAVEHCVTREQPTSFASFSLPPIQS